jgi:hypothetical protein
MKLARWLQSRVAGCVASSLLASSPKLQMPRTVIAYCMALNELIQTALTDHTTVLQKIV